ncbi:MAG TPA: 30S ribosomal protein S3 [Nitrososphaeraceae archaeon]|nr:30S ribosomal protein S3 [Nitrososphaeraceae archaeon]
MSAIKNVMKNNFRNMELNEYLSSTLTDAGYGGAEVQKTPIGTKITLFVIRPGLVIGRKGSGIRDLTSKLEQQFDLENAQVSVTEVTKPELNPNIMANRIAQLIERGTAFRRASLWTINTIMGAGALGVEITVSGKLRGERAHFEKHTAGIIPKSGKVAEEVVRNATRNMLTKMGLVGIKLKISIREEVHRDFDLEAEVQPKTETEIPIESEGGAEKEAQGENKVETTEQDVPANSETKTENTETKTENTETKTENTETKTENTESKDIIDNQVKEVVVNKSET